MTTTTNLNQVPYDFDPEQYNKLLQQVAPSLYGAGVQAQEELKMPAGIWDEEKFRQITAHLRQPYVEQGEQALGAITASMRARGMVDSTRHGKY